MAVSNVYPGHRMWLDAASHGELFVMTRELLPQADNEPTIEVIRTTIRDLPRVSNHFFLQGVKVPSAHL